MMRFGVCLALMICSAFAVNAQVKKYDSTMKVGRVGYRVFTTNRGVDKNTVSITPIGFDNSSREVSLEVKGRITRSEVDDLNNDGFPDLVMYVYNAKNSGTVVAISSEKNQGLAPIFFPDILDDMKLRVGYYNADEYFLMEGALSRKFPVYNAADTAHTAPTGTIRQVMYRVVPDEKGTLRFKVIRSFDINKPQ